MKCFIVNSKDLFDRKKNPHLTLSPREIEKNPKIRKRYLTGSKNRKGVVGCPDKDKDSSRRFILKETHWDELELERRLGN